MDSLRFALLLLLCLPPSLTPLCTAAKRSVNNMHLSGSQNKDAASSSLRSFTGKVKGISDLIAFSQTSNSDNELVKSRIPTPALPRYLVLVSVPVLWGTYPAVVKNLFEHSVVKTPPVIFNLLSYAVSYAVFAFMEWWFTLRDKSSAAPPKISRQYPTGTLQLNKDMGEQSSTSFVQGESINRKQGPVLWQAGLELGLWLFLGSIFLVNGIQGTTATRYDYHSKICICFKL